jgi:cell division protein FtsZ
MAISLQAPDIRELKPHITVFGVGGAGGNAVNNMIESGLQGVEFVVANTDAQALTSSKSQRIIQMGLQVTEGLGAGSQPEVGRAAAEEVIDEIRDQLSGSHMVFITAGMGGGTGTGAAPVIARAAREMGILTVGVVTKPFQFEGVRRMKLAESGIGELQQSVDTLIVIPNQNLFRVANEKTTFADAFAMADQVLYSGVACITDLMVKEGLINLDFADVRAVMRGMGKAMMGTGEASGEKRAMRAAEAAIANPLLDDVSMKGARGLLISITGGRDLTLYELDEAATRIREEVDSDANIILGATFDETLEGIIRVSVVATGIDQPAGGQTGEVASTEQRISEVAERLRAEARARVAQAGPTFRHVQPIEPVKAAPAQLEPIGEHAPLMAAPAPVEAPRKEAPRVEAAPGHPVIRDEVVLTPSQPKSAVPYDEAPTREPAYREEPIAPPTYVPPQADRPVRAPRMPRVDELPLPGRREMEVARGQAPAPENKSMSLIKRLTTVGFGRKDELPAQPQEAPRQMQRPAAEMRAPVAPVHQEYVKQRPAAPQPQAYRAAEPQAYRAPESHARAAAPARPVYEEDQLEIPAFLRRSS